MKSKQRWIKECIDLNRVLSEGGYQNSLGLILRLCILARRGLTNAGEAWAAALACPSVAEAANLQTGCWPPDETLGHSLLEQIGRLLAHMNQTTIAPGDLYELLLPDKKGQGAYYTPAEVVDFILSHTVGHADVVADPWIRIIDPACGCGAFLLVAYDILTAIYRTRRSELQAHWPDEDWSDDGIHRHILGHNLWGADLDETAADIACATLLLKRPEIRAPLPHIVCCDSLACRQDGAKEGIFNRTYQYVIGNPPYISFGLRGTGQLAKEYRDYLREAYPASAEYKLSYYAMFMELGIDILSPGGCLGFIVPDSFLLGRYYSKIRRHMLLHTAVEVLASVSQPVFRQVSAGFNIICILRKKPAPCRPNESERTDIYLTENKSGLAGSLPVHTMATGYFASLPHNRFRLFFDAAAERIVRCIDRRGRPLSLYATGHTGVRSLTRQEDIVSECRQGGCWQAGLVSGSQVLRYHLEYRGHYLNIDPAKLYKGGWRKEVVAARKLLVRQTGYDLTACIDDSGYYHLNNIHSFVPRQTAVSVDYLLLLFNSRLFSFYYHITSMEGGRSLAQTDIETLELLPVCESQELMDQAGVLAAAMGDYQQRRRQGDSKAGDEFASLDRKIDRMVYELYGLTSNDISYIEAYEQELRGRQRHNSEL